AAAPPARASLWEPRLDAEAVAPVGKEAHCLVVAEVRLPHPALRLRAADAPAFGRLGDREVLAAVDRRRTDDDHLYRRLRARGTGGLDDLGHREGQLTQALARRRADREDLQAPRLEVGPDDLGHL